MSLYGRRGKHVREFLQRGASTDTEAQSAAKIQGIQLQQLHQFHNDAESKSMFVQMSELNQENTFWEERSRWIKYEERKEDGSERWGRAHLSSLSFNSVNNLRYCLENGIFVLDFKARDFGTIAYKLVEEGTKSGHITENQMKSELMQLLLLRHEFVDAAAGGLDKKGEHGIKLLRSLRRGSTIAGIGIDTQRGINGASTTLSNEPPDLSNVKRLKRHISTPVPKSRHTVSKLNYKSQLSMEPEGIGEHGILRCLKPGTEGTIVLVGTWRRISSPLCGFVRLAEGTKLPNAMEVPIPVRFVFLLLTPLNQSSRAFIVEPHEVGRSLATMMSNPTFLNECYKIERPEQIFGAIGKFLDSSFILPSGDWDSTSLISMSDIKDIRSRNQAINDLIAASAPRSGKDDDLIGLIDLKDLRPLLHHPVDEWKIKDRMVVGASNPLQRGSYIFHGVVQDIKYRFAWYSSDFADGLNGQCIAATIFIYCAMLSSAVAFGGLTSDATDQQIGIPETLITSSVAGVMFALFSGQPLIMTGVTGPILLYDESLFNFSKDMEVDFLQWRVWIGLWLLAIALVVAAFQGSVLVRYFSKFTKDIFASLVCFIYIVKALEKLKKIFDEHPLQLKEEYCHATHVNLSISTASYEKDNDDIALTHIIDHNGGNIVNKEFHHENEPNTALLSLILMFGTFFIAYFLKLFRNAKYMGRTIRRGVGDFGVPIAIVLMVLLDYWVGDIYTKKLDVPFGLQTTTEGRGWFINPLMSNVTVKAANGTMIEGPRQIPIWLPFISIVPAFLLYLVVFIETEICELMMLERSTKKGGGLHWDIVLLCFINACAAIFGGPWICGATVKAVAHVSALTVMSTNHAPGEAPHVVEVKEQRVSALIVSLLVGFSVLLATALRHVPFVVLYGVFLYMGVCGINGIQFFDRVALLFMPVKHHPNVGYTRGVKTWRMYTFTLCQAIGLGILWAIKSIPAIALTFPFFVVGMIGIRWSLMFIFTENELEHLDGATAGKVVDKDGEKEADFYDKGIGG